MGIFEKIKDEIDDIRNYTKKSERIDFSSYPEVDSTKSGIEVLEELYEITSQNGLSQKTKNDNETTSIEYQQLQNYKLIELKLVNNVHKLFIVNINRNEYIDIFTNQVVYDQFSLTTKLKLINEYDLKDYLVTYGEVKGSYSSEDIERIYNKILEDYQFEKDKTLVNE